MISGVVIVGEGKAGKEYNLPTANLRLYREPDLDYGVYAATASVDGKTHKAIVSYGARMTEKFEVHLFKFSGDLYGKDVDVAIQQKVSDMLPFVDEASMRKKVREDIRLAKKVLFD